MPNLATVFLRPFVFAVLTTASIGSGGPLSRAEHSNQCRPTGELVRLPDVPEASGLTISRRVPGRLWTHNDSAQPVLFALDERGTITERLHITGATVEDWEAVASARCGNDVCLYVADIGDNNAKRDDITIYQVREPEQARDSSAKAVAFHAKYPDGAQDAETLLVAPDGRLHIVTKGDTGPITLYRFPAELRSDSTMQLERIGAVSKGSKGRVEDRSHITDGSISADGRWAVLRSHDALTFFRAADLLAGKWQIASRVDLSSLEEPQGEGVALGTNNTIFVAGEGGSKDKPGTFARLSCPALE